MEVVIIGGGPAGIITGLYLLEKGIKPLILEKKDKNRVNNLRRMLRFSFFKKNSI